MTLPAEWSALVTAISATVAALGLLLSAWQYYRTQKWVQLRFAYDLVDKLYVDESLCLAKDFIEWQDRTFLLPQRYIWAADENGQFQHSLSAMRLAMAPSSRALGDDGNTDLKPEFRRPQYTLYVHVFDNFFDYLDQIETFAAKGLLRPEHLLPIVHLIKRMHKSGLFADYLEFYDIRGVQRLFKRVA